MSFAKRISLIGLTLIGNCILFALPCFAQVDAPKAVEAPSSFLHWINFRVSPIGLLAGVAGADVDFALGKHWSIGPSVSYFSTNDSAQTMSVAQAGLIATFYLEDQSVPEDVDPSNSSAKPARIRGGWLIRPSVQFVPISAKRQVGSDSYSGSLNLYSINLVGGYQWTLPSLASGLNFSMGAGVNYHTNHLTVRATNSSNSAVNIQVGPYPYFNPVLEMSLGWAI